MPDRVFTGDQLDSFRREGFVVAPGMLDREATEALIRAAREVEAMPEVPGRQMVYWETSQRGDGIRMIQRIIWKPSPPSWPGRRRVSSPSPRAPECQSNI